MAKTEVTATAKEKPAKRPPKTIKEKRFANALVSNGGNAVEAVITAGYNVKDEHSARSIASENLHKLAVVDDMNRIEGLGMLSRLNVLREGIYATKKRKLSQEEALQNVLEGKGKDMYEVVPDFSRRYDYLELSFRLDGTLKAGESITNNFTQNNYNLAWDGE